VSQKEGNQVTLPVELQIQLNHFELYGLSEKAELAHKAKYIEHWGSGTLKIIDNMRAADLKDPIFRQKKRIFRCYSSA